MRNANKIFRQISLVGLLVTMSGCITNGDYFKSETAWIRDGETKQADVRMVLGAPYSMFDFAPVGITVLLTGTVYMALIGRRLLPSRDPARELGSGRDFKSLYELHDRLVLLHLPEGSILQGKTLAESRLGSVLGLNVVAVIRKGHTQLSPEPAFTLQSGDRILSVYHLPAALHNLHRDKRIWIITEANRSFTTVLFPCEY